MQNLEQFSKYLSIAKYKSIKFKAQLARKVGAESECSA